MLLETTQLDQTHVENRRAPNEEGPGNCWANTCIHADPKYLELWNGERRHFAKVILAAGDFGFEVLEGDGAVSLSRRRDEPVFGHDGWMEV